jgi:hypothetical protein
MMMIPSISAIEYNEIEQEWESKINDGLIFEEIEELKTRLSRNFERIKNILDTNIWSILLDIINDIIGAIVIFVTFNGINSLFLLLIPPFVSIPLVVMMKLIEFGVYGAILFDLIRNILNLIITIFFPTDLFTLLSSK